MSIKQRQADPHSHALVLDPYAGCIAYVPCLGKDLIREFHYDIEKGAIEEELNFLPSGLCTGHPDGPRYVCFHPRMSVAYVVNELSSTVSKQNYDKNCRSSRTSLMLLFIILFTFLLGCCIFSR